MCVTKPKADNPRVQFLIDIAYWAVIIAIIFLVFRYLLNLLMPIFLAFVFAAVARPLAKLLSRETKYVRNDKGEKVLVRRKVHLNRTFAGVLSVVVLFVIVGGLLTILLVKLVNSISDIVVLIPDYYEKSLYPAFYDLYQQILVLTSRYDESVIQMVESSIPNLISSIGSAVTSLSAKLVTWLTSLAASLPSILLKTVICLIATVFTAVDFDRIKSFIRRNLAGKTLRYVTKVRDSFLDMIWKFIRSYFFIFCITVAEITVGLLIIGQPNPLLWAAIIGIFDAFPIVGSGMILLPWGIITLIIGSTGKGIGIIILYAFVVIFRQFIEPKIVGTHVGLRPIVTLSCMYAGTKLFGGIGLFALPIAAAIVADLNDRGVIHLFTRASSEEGEKKPKGKEDDHDD